MAKGLSRAEQILLAKLNGEEYKGKPLSRVEELLIDLNVGSGGGGDVDDLRKDVLQLKSDVGLLDKETQTNSADIETLQTDMETAQNKITTNVKAIEELDLNLSALQSDVIDLEDHAILDSDFPTKTGGGD